MTLMPIAEEHLVETTTGPKFTVGPECANPHCTAWADDPHHIFSAGKFGKSSWVIVDGHKVGNLAAVCRPCHDDLTGRRGGHRAAIRYNLETKVFSWAKVLHDATDPRDVRLYDVGPLKRQPPTRDTPSMREPGQVAEPEHCPYCGQARRRDRPDVRPPGSPRRRQNWIVSVPEDEIEDGADILDVYVEDIALLLDASHWPERNKRYWALLHALAWVLQQREQFARDIREAVEA